MRKSLFIGLLALSSTMIFAQNQEQRIKEPEKITFKPHWFIQAQIGAAHTIGEAKFTDLVSPAAALNVGYKFAPAFGARAEGDAERKGSNSPYHEIQRSFSRTNFGMYRTYNRRN